MIYVTGLVPERTRVICLIRCKTPSRRHILLHYLELPPTASKMREMKRMCGEDTKAHHLLGRAAGESELCSSWWEVRAVAWSPVDGWVWSISSRETMDDDGVFSATLGLL